jgi:predicted phage terminase large subunit-like protein
MARVVHELRRQVEALRKPKGAADRPAKFADWLNVVSPPPLWRWDAPHLRHVRRALARVTRGDLKRLMIFCPPRHGKSEQTTVRYPVYRLERTPSIRVCIGAYSQTFAAKFGRKARRIARERGLPLSTERSAAMEWETEAGGVFRSCGVGNPPTGEGFDLVVIDDSIKSREEAESEAYRERVWDWYTDDLYTRLEPGGAIVVMQTRWHLDDLPGRILTSDDAANWEVVNLPAEAEADDPLGREVGAPLWPERFDKDALTDRRRVLGPSYYALYQQRPVPREGGMVKREWLANVVPGVPRGCQFVRYWDKAGTAGGGDYTAGVLMGRDHLGIFYVADIVHGQWAAVDRERIILATAGSDRATYGTVRVVIEQEPGSGGKESAESTIRALAGYVVTADRPTGDKAIRLEPFAAQAGAGNVRLVTAPWNREYIEELTTFPAARHDDLVDATAGAFNLLAGVPTSDRLGLPAPAQRTLLGGRHLGISY